MSVRNRDRLGILMVLGMLALTGGTLLAEEDNQKVRGSAVDYRVNQEVLIVYQEGQADAAKEKAEAGGLEVLEDYKPGHFLRARSKPGIRALMTERVNQIADAEFVRVVEPNYTVSIPRPPRTRARRATDVAASRGVVAPRTAAACAPPNDANLNKLWGMTNCRALDAWCMNHDSPVIVAVIDTGVDYNHEDLKANMWVNAGETPGNNKDDDGNGIVDDIHGAKFDGGKGSGDPMDDNKHGTHCAGTIAAVGNNNIGVAGVNWKVQIMALKFLRGDGSGSTNDAIRCIDYAIAKGAKVMSNSWGGGGRSQALQDAIARAEQKGILFVAAAGNESNNNDSNPSFPASYDNANVLAVAAITPSEDLSFFSNFGAKSVDLAAPGGAADGNKAHDIFSTLPGNKYGALAGTSMATPHVSGAAALALAHPAYKNATAVEIKELLIKNSRAIGALSGKCVSGGTLDLTFISTTTDLPSRVAYVGATNQSGGAFVLNGSSGNAMYCLGGGGFYQTVLTSEGTATTPDGYLGWTYKEDYQFSPFVFLFTKDTIGNTTYHRVYTRPADNPTAPFTWFCDASRCEVVEGQASTNALRAGAFDKLRERVQRKPENHGR